MLEEIATVKKLNQDSAVLSTSVKQSCAGCEQTASCGTGVIARYLAPKVDDLVVKLDGHNLCEGQSVVIGLSERAMLKMAALVYLAPILIFIVSAISLSLIFPVMHELWGLLLSALLTTQYYWLLKGWLSRVGRKSFETHIVKTLPLTDKGIPVQIVDN